MAPDEIAALQAAVILSLKSLGFKYAGASIHVDAVSDDSEEAAPEYRDEYVNGPITVTLAARV